MALTKQDIKIIKNIVDDSMDKKFEQFAKIVGKGFLGVDKKFEEVDKRFNQIDERFEEVDKRFEGIEAHLEHIDIHLEHIDAHLEHIDARLNTVEHDMAEMRDDHVSRYEFAQLSKRVSLVEHRLSAE